MYRSIYEWLDTQQFSEQRALECGALDFQDTSRLASHFKTVLAFEANPHARVPDLPSNVIVELQALSTKTGSVTWYRDDNPLGNSGASSLLPSSPFFLRDYIKQETAIQVPCISLSDALQKHQLSHVDFFWLDMEGYELSFLKGTDLSNVQFIYTEVNFQPFRQGGCLFADLRAYLESQNFRELHRWVKDDTWNGDVLFEKRVN